ncbi:MAG: hypothetical protein ACTHK8_23190 [Ginsengibacter sp.]
MGDHPFIVLSVQECNSFENTFIAVMITSSSHYDDDLSFPLLNDMFETNLRKPNSKARMHLIMLCLDNEIIGNRINVMKQFYFNKLMKEIGSLVFNFNFTPL